jgi:hypothetical protein
MGRPSVEESRSQCESAVNGGVEYPARVSISGGVEYLVWVSRLGEITM